MNAKATKVDPFSVGNVASDFHDAIVGTYGLGQCEQMDPDSGKHDGSTPLPRRPRWRRTLLGAWPIVS